MLNSLTNIWWLFKEKEYDYGDKRKPLDLITTASVLVMEHPSEVAFLRTKVPAVLYCVIEKVGLCSTKALKKE